MNILLNEVMAQKIRANLNEASQSLANFSKKANELINLATEYAETVDSPSAKNATKQLNANLDEVGDFLDTVVSQSKNNQSVLEKNYELLKGLEAPLKWFMKTHKKLAMLAVSTKIESARIGDAGSGFLTLVKDVDKLALQIHDHATTITKRCEVLADMLLVDLNSINSIGRERGKNGFMALDTARYSMTSLESSRSSSIEMAERTSVACRNAIAKAEQLDSCLHEACSVPDEQTLQPEGSLQDFSYTTATGCLTDTDHGSDEDHYSECDSSLMPQMNDENDAAVPFALTNFCMVEIADELERILSCSDTNESEQHFIDEINKSISVITKELGSCAETDSQIVTSLVRAAKTISEITAFVDDIRSIGSEIDLLSINAQISAALTGEAGAGLGVLAQALVWLSRETVESTESVAGTLSDINSSTARISRTATEEQVNSEFMISSISTEIVEVTSSLAAINSKIMERTAQFRSNSEALIHQAHKTAMQLSFLEHS